MTPQLSGIVQNILYRVGDINTQTFSSGQVQYLTFVNLQQVNAIFDVQFSGVVDSDITPPITGTILLPPLELLTAKNLVGNRLFSAANEFTITSFKEGDSQVNVADKTKALGTLYKLLSDELNEVIAQTKFTIASRNPSSVAGLDAGIVEQISFRNYDTYRANQT